MSNKTPAQEMGLEVGDKVEVIHDSDGYFNDGEIVALHNDDTGGCPSFISEDGGVVGDLYLNEIKLLSKKAVKKQASMKPYKKTKRVEVGVWGTLESLFRELVDVCVCHDGNSDDAYCITEESKLTIKIKGKKVDPKDIKIYIED